MHVLKVSWSGQTFALAKCNDSEGRKSRVRRSKEERKTMVESFINEFRTSNNGKFPSLNLTHKEVGGSFYTVREIVREIIQENKVLGPATTSLEEHRADHSSEQYVLHSLCVEPHSHLSSSEIGDAIDLGQEEVLSVTNDDQSTCEDVTISRGQSISRCYEMVESKDGETNILHFVHSDQQQNSYDGRYMNGNLVGEECKEEEATELSEPEQLRTQEDEMKHSQVNAHQKLGDELGKQNDIMETSAGSTADDGTVFRSMELDITSEANVVMNVDTSSISLLIQEQPSATTADCSSSKDSEALAMTGMLQSQETNLSTEKVELPSGVTTSDTISTGDMPSLAVDERTETETATSFPASESTLVNDFSTNKISYLSKGTGLESSISHDAESNLETYDQKHLVTGATLQQQSVPNNSQIEKVVSVATIDSVNGVSHSSATDRISSKLSEKATEEPAKAEETNPIWLALKAFVTAFVKFWVE
ncbi:hypothetical protein MRB53_004685 [Persea americana]|uniref:Uncharacterized protein n=1 Tax=Persea americana TaxID=3435 RepID=A0ACC2MB89_PERAE|nr:hypothetical protein MRB53_004685 [Persea americana]|eukprot:TRINITY_DN13221_c0_g1_i2.p1 TRINITY_DN13221_c0_g1~~TRINITY_DN13221_c0_g1_i2.p1  ORF type:complete len:478 (+),score=114.39 TRINITY_DN13221_c0_g1_i2:244-1677(+)